jgi:hypothetical protein
MRPYFVGTENNIPKEERSFKKIEGEWIQVQPQKALRLRVCGIKQQTALTYENRYMA